jgi:hypothetical protein
MIGVTNMNDGGFDFGTLAFASSSVFDFRRDYVFTFSSDFDRP